MSIINTNAKEMHFKVLYYGPEGSGKKSSLLYIKSQFHPDKLDFFSLNLEKEIYALILEAGQIYEVQTFFHIYNAGLKSDQENEFFLKGVDGIIFVASSMQKDRQNNKAAFLALERSFKKRRQNPFKVPMVIQYNKSDVSHSIPLKELRKDLNKYNNKDFQSSTVRGEKVLEPLKYLCKLIVNHFK